MRVALIWAMAQNRVIGNNNNLPWYLPNDLAYFKRITSGKAIIMGRKTYESIGKPLPNRVNIVITRKTDFHPEGVRVVNSLEEALELAQAIVETQGGEEVIIMGGAEIYALSLAKADRLYLTQVHAEVVGDAYFPEFDLSQFREIHREDYAAEGPNPYDYSFVVYDRL